MTTVALSQDQQGRLQDEVQLELERREWAEPGDNVMAEYVTVLIANGNNRDRVLTEMDDLVGSDIDPSFLDWLFDKASDIQQSSLPPPAPAPLSPVRSTSASAQPQSSYNGASRMLNSALASSREDTNKRKADTEGQGQNKKRVSDQGLPSGPRAMVAGAGIGGEGRSLQDRMGPRRQVPAMQVRGVAGRQQGAGMGMGFQQSYRPAQQMPQIAPQMMQPGFGFFPQQQQQQEMMAQMMMMQANMAQMGEMMQKMAEEKEKTQTIAGYGTEKPSRPVKVPHGTKLGSHSVSAIAPKPSSTGPIPEKPTSKALCRYSVGCSNSRCPYSHPSPMANEQTGMVLSEEACEEGKKCKDAECTKSHVSPAAILGESAGPSRLLCKYQNCTNPACPFRHEDAEGNSIPPPALSAAKTKKTNTPVAPAIHPSSDNEDGDVEVVMSSKNLMDGALDDGKSVPACRYGERCTRPDCKFTHPASRATPKPRGSYSSRGGVRRPGSNGEGVATTGMNKSKKFGEAAKLNPVAGEFVPKERELEVSN